METPEGETFLPMFLWIDLPKLVLAKRFTPQNYTFHSYLPKFHLFFLYFSITNTCHAWAVSYQSCIAPSPVQG